MLDLKKEIEEFYGCKLNLNNNCLDYPFAKLAENKTYKTLLFEEIIPYFRKVVVKNKSIKKAFLMENGMPKFQDYQGEIIDQFFWYITIINDEVTLFSNDLYLAVDDYKNIKGSEWMTKWKFEKKNEKYLFYYIEKNNVLTVDGNNAILTNENYNKFQQFELFDII